MFFEMFVCLFVCSGCNDFVNIVGFIFKDFDVLLVLRKCFYDKFVLVLFS